MSKANIAVNALQGVDPNELNDMARKASGKLVAGVDENKRLCRPGFVVYHEKGTTTILLCCDPDYAKKWRLVEKYAVSGKIEVDYYILGMKNDCPEAIELMAEFRKHSDTVEIPMPD